MEMARIKLVFISSHARGTCVLNLWTQTDLSHDARPVS
jgi:hypothetical protein